MKKQLTAILLAVLMVCGILAPVKAEAAASADDYRAVWFSYYDYEDYLKSADRNNAAEFTTFFRKVVGKCKTRGMNRIIVQVRPTGDAIYDSDIFPTSSYISGKQGRDISYDPLAIMWRKPTDRALPSRRGSIRTGYHLTRATHSFPKITRPENGMNPPTPLTGKMYFPTMDSFIIIRPNRKCGI